MIDTLVNILDPIAIFLLDATVKTTLFMGLVLFVVWLLSTRQAARRSLLLSWCLVGVLVIPIASLCMPSLRFQFDSPPPPSEPAIPSSQPVVVPETPLAKPTPELQQQRVSARTLSQDIELPQDFVVPSLAQIVFEKNAETKSVNWTTYILNKITSTHALYGMMAVYAIGVLVLLIRVIYCLIMVWKFRRSLLPCEDEQLRNDLQVLKNQLGIRRSVALSVSDQIGSPTQIGILKPVVVLPAPMVKSSDQLKTILIHELIHVKRWDCLYRLLAMIGMAFYWFNPLFHRVKHLLFEVQEQACDDWTVTTTGNSESYADTLLNVATLLQPRPAMTLGMDMARMTQIMDRVNRIITLGDHVTPRVDRVSALVTAVAFIGGSMAIGCLSTGKVDDNNKKIVFEGGVAVTDTSKVSHYTLPLKMRDGRRWWHGSDGLYLQDGDAWQKFTLPEGGSLVSISAFLQAHNGSLWFAGVYKGRPVIANFNGKTWRIWDNKMGLGEHGVGSKFAEDTDGEVHAGTLTDEDGRYRVEVTPGVYRVRIASKNAAEPVTVDTKAKDKVEDVDLLLLNPRRISGRVVDTSDNPIANAVVVISDDTSRDRRLSPQIVTTDANGKFAGWQVSGPKATFEVAVKGYAQTALTVENAVENQIEIVLKKGISLRGRVVDESDQPVARARVAFGRPPMPRAKYTAPPPLPFHHNTYTDTSGLFTLQNIDVDKGHIWVSHPDIGIMNQKIVSADNTIKLKIDAESQAVMDIDIPVKRFRVYSISGVVSLKENSVEGLEIRAFPTKRSNVPAYPKIDQTDANGVYRLDDLEPGEHRIIMSLIKEKEIDGRTKTIHYPVQSQTLIIEDRDVTLNFAPLSDVYSVSGVVSLNEGSVEGVKIMAFSAKRSRGRIFPKTDYTDANGAYRLDYLEPGEYRILVSAPEPEEVEKEGHTKTIHHSGQSRTLVIEDRDVTLNFEPLSDARITGVAIYNGQPVSDVYVGANVLTDDLRNYASLRSTKTNKKGQFEVRDLPSTRIALSFSKWDRPFDSMLWSKVDTVDLTKKKKLNYMENLAMLPERDMQKHQSTHGLGTLRVWDMAPDFEAKRLDGSTFRLSDYRGKKAVLIDFWATWCGPCIKEIPMLKSIAETYRDQGLEVVGVSLDRDEKALRDFVKKEKLNYVQVYGREKAQEISKSYGVWGIPAVFLVDKNGVINAMNLRGERTEEAVKALLATGATD